MDEMPNGRRAAPRLADAQRLVRLQPRCASGRPGSAGGAARQAQDDGRALAAALAAALSVAAE